MPRSTAARPQPARWAGCHVHFLVCLLACAIALVGRPAAGATLTWPFGPYTYPTGISGDGSVIAYTFAYSGPSAGFVSVNGVSHGLTPAPPYSPYTGAFAGTAGVSVDGSTVVGSSTATSQFLNGPNAATLWRTANPSAPQSLSLPGGAVNAGPAYGVNANGSVVVGETVLSFSPTYQTAAVRWAGSTAQVLANPYLGGSHGAGMSVSGDGSIVVGWGDQNLVIEGVPHVFSSRPVVWTFDAFNNPLAQALPDFGLGGSANAISADGSTIVGWTGLAGGYQAAAIWRRGTDGPNDWQLTSLGRMPGEGYGVANSVSGDGSIVVGQHDGKAFIWTEELGRVDLKTYALSLGIELNGLSLSWASAISADGHTIAGYGGGIGFSGAWVLVMPVPEPSSIVLVCGAVPLTAVALVRRRRAAAAGQLTT